MIGFLTDDSIDQLGVFVEGHDAVDDGACLAKRAEERSCLLHSHQCCQLGDLVSSVK